MLGACITRNTAAPWKDKFNAVNRLVSSIFRDKFAISERIKQQNCGEPTHQRIVLKKQDKGWNVKKNNYS